MSQLYEMCQQANNQLELMHVGDALGLIRAKGMLATRTGFLVSLVTPNDPDDAGKRQALRDAAESIGIRL